MNIDLPGNKKAAASTKLSVATKKSAHPKVVASEKDQISAGYKPDSWTMTTLPKGSRVYGGLPGQSPYYTMLWQNMNYSQWDLLSTVDILKDTSRTTRAKGIWLVS